MKKHDTELTDAFDEQDINKFSAGQTLTFRQDDGSMITYKITRIKDYRMWGKEIRLYRPDEIKIVNKINNKATWKNNVK